MYPKNENIYLDSNSLVAYFVPKHEDHTSISITMAKLLIGNNNLHFSPLVIDETMMAIIKIYNKGKGLPPSDFYIEVKNAVQVLLSHKQMKLRQFENSLKQGTLNAVENLKDFILKPRDSFHLSYMYDWNIKYILTKDHNFDRVKNIVKLGY